MVIEKPVVVHLGNESYHTCLQARKHLHKGVWVSFVGIGRSMEPMIPDGTRCLIRPVRDDETIVKGMALFCKVRGGYALHKVRATKGNGRFILIGNNHGHIDGWTTRKHVYGVYLRAVEVTL